MRFWFRLISSNLMPSQNEYVIPRAKVTLVGCIMDQNELNLGSIIALEILSRAKQEQRSLSFPTLITTLCKRDGVPKNIKIDTAVTLSATTNIYQIKAEYLRDEKDRVGRS